MWILDAIAHMISGSAPVVGLPDAALQYFLYLLPGRVRGNPPDLPRHIDRIKAAATEADTLWDRGDRGETVDAVLLAEARVRLATELRSLGGTRFWGRLRPDLPLDSTVPAEGCGLLNVLAWIYERDASIYKIVLELQRTLAGSPNLPDMMWALEVGCFVWPEKGPVSALVAAIRDARIPWDDWAGPMIIGLRADDFWVPVGAKSLDKLTEALAPPGDGGGAGPAPLDEGAVRENLARFHWKWFELRDAMKVGVDNQAILRRIIVFRRQLTDRLMLESVTAVGPDERARFTPYIAAKFAVPGSTRLTSDIDVNMRGSATELVAIEFNRRFRAWSLNHEIRPTVELESGYVFDVNVYAQDYTRDLGLRYMKRNAPGPDVWPEASSLEWTKAEKSQDQYALIKMRSYMAKFPFLWSDFCNGVRNRLSVAGMREFGDRVKTANKEGVELAALKETAKANVRAAFPGMQEAYADNVRTRAENNLYEVQLREVYTRRGFGAALSDERKLVLIKELGKASYFAQEAYYTAGAVRDVVSNLQMGQGLRLSMYEQLHSFNEQVADIFKDLGHFPGAPLPDQMLDFAVDASKYMARMATAALSASYEVVTKIFERQLAVLAAPDASAEKTRAAKDAYVRGLEGRLNGLLDLQTLFGTWRDRSVRIMKIKDNPVNYKTPDGAWTAAAQEALGGAPWSAERVTFTNAIRNLAVVMNVEARSEPTSTMRTGLAGQAVLFRIAQAAVLAPAVVPAPAPAPRGNA